LGFKFLFAFVFVLALIGATTWIVRRFGIGAHVGSPAVRGRQPRLAMIDAAPVDGRRRLVLVRRDNVEHLLLVGGPSDILVEQNIVRAVPVASPRDVPLPRAPGVADAMVRAPEPAVPPRPPESPSPRLEPAPRLEPSSRPEVPPRPDVMPRPEMSMRPDVSPRTDALPRAPRPSEPRMLPAAETLDVPALVRQTPPAAPVARSVPEQQTAPEPRLPQPTDAELTDMAQRLEAALRRPMQPGESRPEPAGRPAPSVAAPPALPSAPPFGAPHGPRESVKIEPARPAPPEPARPQPEAKPAAAKSVFDSLEQEMASLLGRPVGKE